MSPVIDPAILARLNDASGGAPTSPQPVTEPATLAQPNGTPPSGSTTLQIDGVGKVVVDNSFLQLSPADQQATVDEIANTHAGAQENQLADAEARDADATPT